MYCLRVAVLALAFAWPSSAQAQCIDGTDCFCDTVSTASTLLWCEDYDARGLWDATLPQGGGAPEYGPWNDPTGLANSCGFNSYWNRTYGSVDWNCAWHNAANGGPENCGGGQTCAYESCFAAEASVGDPWQGNSFACFNAMQNTAEATLDTGTGIPDVVPGDDAGVPYEGNALGGYRVPTAQTAGIFGNIFHTSVSDVGLTMVRGYSDNVITSGVTAFPWKDHEWDDGVGVQAYPEMWHSGNTGTSGFPFAGFRWQRNSSAQADCNTAVSGATISAGTADCSTVALRVGTAGGFTDPAPGQLFCLRAQMLGMGTANMSYRISWTDHLGNENVAFEMTGFDDTIGGKTLENSAYSTAVLNAYANANQQGGTPTTQTAYRYEDNVVLVNGPAEPCSTVNWPRGAPPVTGNMMVIGANAAGVQIR